MSAPVAQTERPREPARSARSARKGQRRPLRKFFIVNHRWPALILGLFLLVIVVSGSARRARAI